MTHIAQTSRSGCLALFFFVLLIAQLFLVNSAAAQFDDAGASNPFGSVSQTDEFLPVEEAYRLLTERRDDGSLSFSWSIADGYYLYGHAFEAEAKVQGGEAYETLELQRPPGLQKTDEYFGEVEVYYSNAQLRTDASVVSDRVSITSQGCADAGLCYPPRTQHFDLSGPAGPVEVDTRQASLGTGTGQTASSAAANTSSAAASGAPLIQETNDGGRQMPPFYLMAWFAFLGGLILNLMPCVFPVLALKVLSLVNASETSLQEQRAHGLSYTAGVIVCFLLVAGLLLALRATGEALGWGFQLQTPWLVGSLAYLFVVLGLAMSGYIELGASWAGAGQGLTERSGHSGSFFTGMLAVVVASPCTAPFMGAALGFALVQPPVLALTIFAALGLGMAAPFLLLVSVPALAKLLPRPGSWMLTFRELMAIPLFLTAVWLCWVVGRQAGVDAMAAVLAGCVLVYAALWLWRRGGVQKTLLAPVLGLAAAAVLLGPWFENTDRADDSSLSYSAERVQELRTNGQAVFVNLTADWCITCLANERVALSKDSVKQAFADNNVAVLKGDWTNNDPRITALLAEYGRSGVPLYLLFPADTSQRATVLPQVLTPDIVISAISAPGIDLAQLKQ